ncbi:MAG TPA: hypothetical protein PLR71_08530 [Deltaproteobacteria bacterium]|nr:hypothetical protein [Deltaproteobacteria bacterium]HQI81591.1 hypothetical protein [Deltaproteobacteria bacterium]
MRFSPSRVKTFDSHKSPGQPVWFECRGRGLEIDEVLEHWSEAYRDPSFFPDEYYKVRAEDTKVYLLRYSHLFKSWWVMEYEVRIA